MTKRERVERALALQPVDRVAVHDYFHSPYVHALFAGEGEEDVAAGSLAEIHRTVRATLDMWRPLDPISSHASADNDGFESASTE
ncbi:MAG: hypothetical protein HQ559_15050, partial [Lentisphaerae bacterium]|nr:hypothetical protein [Lentisphaerota bacterium]